MASPALPDLDDRPAEEILRFAIDEFFPDIAVACSMQDAVVVDLAWKIQPGIEVFFLETSFHFAETLETTRRLKERYDLNLVSLRPVEDAAVYSQGGFDACCRDRKVTPLERYLQGKRAWVSGIRRADGESRQAAKAVEWDEPRQLVKINPLVSWSDEDVAAYIDRHDVIVNPLRFQGFESIGCAPCSRPGKGREGRWGGTGKTECGIHRVEPPLDRPSASEESR